MKLDPQQIQDFERDGYLFFPSLFKPEEIKVLLDEVPRLYAHAGRRTCARRQATPCARTSPPTCTAPLLRSSRHPRMVEPIMQLFGEELYMHQFKINGKMAFDGERLAVAPGLRHLEDDDLMPEARAMNVAIFLDEVNEFKRAADAHSRQPQAGRDRSGPRHLDDQLPLWTINHDTMRKLVERGGIVAPKGPPGSMILFHSCLVHASTSNLSPWNRVSVYLSLCAVSNHIRRFKRPGYIAHPRLYALEVSPR